MKNKTLVLFLFCLVGFTEAARAQQPPHVECESNAACMSLFELAQQQSSTGQLQAAAVSYKAAYNVNQDPRLLFSVARVLDKSGQAAEAITYYQRFIASAVEDVNQKDKAREYLKLVEAKQTPPAVLVPSSPLQEVPAPASAAFGSSAPLAPSATPLRDIGTAVPAYKKGWFWGPLVGSVAAVGLVVGLGVGILNRRPSFPADVNTFDPSF
jgi:tetratricopeptide (TPR) repeat protein